MEYKTYIDHLEYFNKELKKTRALSIQYRKEYFELLEMYKSKLELLEDNDARNELYNQFRFLIEVSKDRISILENDERVLLTEKQDLTLTYQIISNKESAKQQRILTFSIFFIGFISLLNAFEII